MIQSTGNSDTEQPSTVNRTVNNSRLSLLSSCKQVVARVNERPDNSHHATVKVIVNLHFTIQILVHNISNCDVEFFHILSVRIMVGANYLFWPLRLLMRIVYFTLSYL